jgi:cysteine synthase A
MGEKMRVGSSMTEVIGDTPLVQLARVVPDGAADVFVKLEWFSPTGSYKDRMALAMVEEAERRGDLRPGMTVVEYTAGSTGSSLAYVCAAKGYPLKVVSSDAYAEEKLRTMRAFGADLTIVPSEGGMVTPDLLPRMIEQAAEYAAEPDTYWTHQRNNADSLVGYRAVGVETLEQMDSPIDVFCAAVGTAGLSMGVSAALADGGSNARIVIFEPASSPLITAGRVGTHHVEGIGGGLMPPLLDPDRYDEARAIDEGKARAMARRLATEEGLLAGTSTGLNVAGAIDIACELGSGRTVVTVAVDTGLKYLSGDLYAS